MSTSDEPFEGRSIADINEDLDKIRPMLDQEPIILTDDEKARIAEDIRVYGVAWVAFTTGAVDVIEPRRITVSTS